MAEVNGEADEGSWRPLPVRIRGSIPEDYNRPWKRVLEKVSIVQISLIVCAFC